MAVARVTLAGIVQAVRDLLDQAPLTPGAYLETDGAGNASWSSGPQTPGTAVAGDPSFIATRTGDGGASSGVPITNWTVVKDTGSGYAGGTYTVPAGKAGLYQVLATLRSTGATSFTAAIIHTAAGPVATTWVGGSFAAASTQGSVLSQYIELDVGDTIEWTINGGPITLDAAGGSGPLTHIGLYRVAE